MSASSRRTELLEGACIFVLDRQPIGTLSLRPLAAALGTSDRMLVYHFGSREGLLVAVLDHLGDQLRVLLETAMPEERIAPRDALRRLAAGMADERAEAILGVWFEMCGLAARGVEPFASEVTRVSDAWIGWLAARLDTESGVEGAAAEAVLAAADGLALLRATTARDAAAAATMIDVAARGVPT
jgi:AcrR family transcriptional regulator